jgi:hypothetical protein
LFAISLIAALGIIIKLHNDNDALRELDSYLRHDDHTHLLPPGHGGGDEDETETENEWDTSNSGKRACQFQSRHSLYTYTHAHIHITAHSFYHHAIIILKHNLFDGGLISINMYRNEQTQGNFFPSWELFLR